MKRYAAFLGFTAVAILALGAHALKKVLTADQLESLNTAAYMQMIHAAILLLLSYNLDRSNLLAKRILRFMSIGIGMFSFSIYLLLLKNQTATEWLHILWPITPLGGVLLMTSWLMLFLYYFRSKE
jgi:uncharacterized membrane protein YgdD (TMEM256/DUF423 family)